METKKRILSLLLIFVMIFSMVPLAAYATNGDEGQAQQTLQDDPAATPPASSTPEASDMPDSTVTLGAITTPDLAATIYPSVQKDMLGGSMLMEASPETVSMVSTLGAGSEHNVNLGSTTSYNLTIDITAQSLATPKLVITVPKNITVSYYPNATNATLASSLAPIANPVSKFTDTSGNTVLTYYFKANVATVGFNITLAPTYKLKTGNSYTISAALYEDTTEQSSTSDTITITGNPTLETGAYTPSYINENVILKDSTDYYYAIGNGYLYSNYNDHYVYDSLEIIVPLPDASTPGYYDGTTFVPLTEGIAKTFTNGTVTYYSNYDLVNASNTTLYSGKKVMIYRLSSAHPLVSGFAYYSYYYYTNELGGIYLRFPGTMTAGTYTSPCTPSIHAYIDGDTENYVLLKDYTAGYALYYTFKAYNIQDFFNQSLFSTYTSAYSYNDILNIEDNQNFYSNITNKTGETLRDVEIEYNVPENIYCYKLAFTLSTDPASFYPSSAVVQYRTKNHPDLQSATMSVDDYTIRLSDPTDAITYIHVVYDKLGTYQSTQRPMKAYVVNRDNINSATAYTVTSRILSAVPTGSISDLTIGAQGMQSVNMYLKQSYTITPGGNYALSSTALSKGDTFNVRFYMTDYPAQITDPCIYMLMPSEFIFSSYQSAYANPQYSISQRNIDVTAETATTYVPAGNYTLYTIRYTGNRTYASQGWHYMYFTVGPQVDTATLRTGVYLPAITAVTNTNAMFPYSTSNTSYRMQDTWDFDNDDNTTEYLPTFYNHPTVTINAVRTITAQSFVTSSYAGSGESTSQSYQYNSTGNYKLYIYNGLDSGNTAKDADISITVPKTAYPSGSNTSAWNVDLTGAPVLSGAFLSGAAVTYSTDGGVTYSATAEDYALVTNIRIRTAQDVLLASSQSASIVLPFVANFPASVNASSRAYFDADFSYYLNSSSSPTSTDIVPNTLSTAPVVVSGAVFKDYNANGEQGGDERVNYKQYHVLLYKGEYTSGVIGLTNIASAYTDYNTGAYSFNNIYTPGTYTVRVVKGSEEHFPSTGLFTQDGSTNDAYYTFTVGEDTTAVSNVNLGIVAPRTLSLNTSSFTLYYQGATRKIVPTITPPLAGGESVTYTSSDENVVTVASDGTLTYVGDGNATVTVRVPQLSALTGTFGTAPVTATVYVYARHTGYGVVYKNHLDADITATLPAAYDSAKNYTYGVSLSLPQGEPYTRSGYTFGGWYTALTGGNRVYSIPASTYGDQMVFARWIANSYGITYQGMSDASYGTHHPNAHTYGTATVISNPSKTGYSFAGWRINGGSEPIKDLTLDAEGYTAAITLSATWTLADPSVTLASNVPGNTVTYGSNITITATASHSLSPAYAYAWYKDVPGDDDTAVGTNSSTLTLTDVSQSGEYYCIVSITDGTQSAQKQSGNITITINRANASVTNISDIGKTYSGTAVSVPTYNRTGNGAVTIEYKAKTDTDAAYSLSAPVDAGVYTVRVSVAQDANHTSASATRDFTISPKAITVTPQSGQTKVYGETDPVLAYTTNAASAVVSGQTMVLFGALGRAPGENAGSYAIGLGSLSLGDGTGANAFRASNYALVLSAELVDFTITNAGMIIASSGYSDVYDGLSHSISVTAPAGAAVYYRVGGGEWSPVNPQFKDAMSAKTVYYKVEMANYTTFEGSETVMITARPVTVTADSSSKAYDGTALTDSGYSITSGSFAFGEGLASVTVEGSQTLVGTSDNTITAYTYNGITHADNYAITLQKGTLAVTQASIPITITADSSAKIYDGTVLTDDGWSLTAGTLAAGDTIESVSVSGEIRNYGTAENIIGAVVVKHDDTDVTSNYIITKNNGTLTINKHALEITADSATKLYDGTALHKDTYAISGGTLPAGDTLEVTVAGGITDVGSVPNRITTIKILHGAADVTESYDITKVDGTLEITKRAVTITAKNNEKVYDGTALGGNGYTLSGDGFVPEEGLNSVTLQGSQLFEGTSSVDVTAHTFKSNTKPGNYEIRYASGALTVHKAAIPIRITASDKTAVYTGAPLKSANYTMKGTLAVGDVLHVTVTGSITNVGTASNNVSNVTVLHEDGTNVTQNYAITKTAGTLEVTAMPYSPSTIDISAIAPQDFTSRALTPAPRVTMGDATLTNGTDYTLSYRDNISPGTARVIVSFIGNYSGATTLSFTITEPTAQTGIATDITKNAVKLRGSSTAAANAEVGFYYKAVDAGQYTKIGATGTPAGFESALGSLTPDTVYVYYAFIIVNGKEYAGKEIRFRTAADTAGQQSEPARGKVDIDVINATGSTFTATISIEGGNTLVASATATGVFGQPFSHSFTELADGQYNIVVRIGDFTETKKVRIKDGTTEKVVFNITSLKLNTIVEIKGSAPDVAVGGITEIFNSPVTDPTKGISREELNTGKDIEIRVVVDEVSTVDEAKAKEMGMIEDFFDGEVGIFIDLSVIKTVTYEDASTKTKLSELPGLLEIAIPIPGELLGKTGYVIYRVHDGVPEAITETPNADGEFIEVTDDGYILLHVRKFSTYAIGYSDAVTTVAATPDISNWWWILAVAVCLILLILFIVVRRRRREERYNEQALR